MSDIIGFRKIKGRIVPIRDKGEGHQKKLAVKGAGLVAGGLALAAGSGEIAARMVKRSAQFRIMGKAQHGIGYRGLKLSLAKSAGQMGLGLGGTLDGSRKAMMARGVISRVKSMRLFTGRRFVLDAGSILGGALIGAGLNRFSKAYGDKKTALGEEVAGGAVGAIAAGAAATWYYRRLGIKNLVTLASFARSRVAKSARPTNIPISFSYAKGWMKKGTLKF